MSQPQENKDAHEQLLTTATTADQFKVQSIETKELLRFSNVCKNINSNLS